MGVLHEIHWWGQGNVYIWGAIRTTQTIHRLFLIARSYHAVL